MEGGGSDRGAQVAHGVVGALCHRHLLLPHPYCLCCSLHTCCGEGDRFLRYLAEQLHLPVYCLVDSDPYGFDILTTYRFGSMQLAHDAKLLHVLGIWLGIFTSDFEEYCLQDYCFLNLTPEDRRRVEVMLTRCYLHCDAAQWRLELEAMLQKGIKFESETLTASSISFLSEEYIPRKIQQGRHL